MDLIFHLFLGLMLAKQGMGVYVFSVAVASMLPDLIGLMHLQGSHIRRSSKKSLKLFFYEWRNQTGFHNKTNRLLYRYPHSLLGWLIITIIFYFISSNYIILSLAYLSHIIIDIMTHEGEFATRLFYPFSDFHIEGKNWATNKKVFISFWLVLAVLAIIQIIV